jgi:hypothetical protein
VVNAPTTGRPGVKKEPGRISNKAAAGVTLALAKRRALEAAGGGVKAVQSLTKFKKKKPALKGPTKDKGGGGKAGAADNQANDTNDTRGQSPTGDDVDGTPF